MAPEYPACCCCGANRIVAGIVADDEDLPVCRECEDAKRCECGVIDLEKNGSDGPAGWKCEVCAEDYGQYIEPNWYRPQV